MNEKEKKRIALVVNTLSSGGAEHVVANLSRALSDRFGVDIILNDDENITYPYCGNIVSVGMPADGNRMSGKYQIAAMARRTALLVRLRRKRRYSAVISFSDNTNMSNVLSRAGGGRSIISVRYSLEGLERSEHRTAHLHRFILRTCCALADKVVCCSEEISCELKEKYPKTGRKLEVIYNGVDLDHPGGIHAAERMKRTYDADEEASCPRIINIGRMSEQKAQWHLLYALRELKERGMRAGLTVLGDGTLRPQLEALAEKLGIDDQVSMPGWTEDIAVYLADSDAAVFTSDYEGFCNAILEAMSCGVPCISTDHRTGAREMIAPGTDCRIKVTDRIDHAEHGILIPVCSGDIGSSAGRKDGAVNTRPVTAEEVLLADAIEELLKDKSLACRYSEAGLKRARELSLKAAADRWARLILGNTDQKQH